MLHTYHNLQNAYKFRPTPRSTSEREREKEIKFSYDINERNKFRMILISTLNFSLHNSRQFIVNVKKKNADEITVKDNTCLF
jgi:hypothetical protein